MSAVVQAVLAWRYDGFWTGDDVELLSEAFRVAIDLPYRAWEVRSLFIPDVLVAPFVLAASLMGETEIHVLVLVAKIPFILAGAISAWCVNRLTLQISADPKIAFVATALFAFHWIPLALSSSGYPRTFAAACVPLAALLAMQGSASAAALGGALVGLAYADRFSEIIFLFPLLLISKRRIATLAGAGAAVFALGMYDWWTWGVPFGSVRKFAEVTLVRADFASRVKHQSPVWYLETLPRWCAATALPFLWLARKRWPMLFVLLPVVCLSLVKHKELRYLHTVVPFLSVAIALGWSQMKNRRLAMVLLALTIAWHVAGIRVLRRKSMPAVRAARYLAADPHIRSLTTTQVWAYGDRIYLGDRIEVRDIGIGGTSPVGLESALETSDAVALYETDLTPEILQQLAAKQFVEAQAFREPPARAVIVYERLWDR